MRGMCFGQEVLKKKKHCSELSSRFLFSKQILDKLINECCSLVFHH